MTNQQIEAAYMAALGNGHASALRAIYTLGYANGASLPIDTNLGDRARSSTAPTVIQVQTVISHPSVKRPD